MAAGWRERVVTPLAPTLQGKELRTVVFVAISFHAVFTGYRSIQNLQSSLNEEEGLGVISLGVLYGAWIFSGVLTPTAIRLLTTKGCLLLAWVCHVLYTAATFYPSWALLMPASLLLGAVSGPLWTAQSLYITACGFSSAKSDSSFDPYTVFSRFNGIFFAIYETSQITGNLVSSLVLQNGLGNRSDETLFLRCGRGDCPADDDALDFEEPEDWVADVLVAVYVSFNLAGLVICYFFVMPLPHSQWSAVTSVRDSAVSFFVTLRHSAIALLVPLFVFQGIQQAVLYSEFTRSYVSCPLGLHMVGFVMAAHGATTPAVTLLLSRVVKRTGRYPLFVAAGLINLALMAVMSTWTPDGDDVAFIFLTPISWGVSEGVWMTQTNSLIAVQFPQQKEPAFAIYHTSRSVGLTLTFALSSFVCASVKLIVAAAVAPLALLLYTGFELRVRWKETRGGPSSSASAPSSPSSTAVVGVGVAANGEASRSGAWRPGSLSGEEVEAGAAASDRDVPSTTDADLAATDGRRNNPSESAASTSRSGSRKKNKFGDKFLKKSRKDPVGPTSTGGPPRSPVAGRQPLSPLEIPLPRSSSQLYLASLSAAATAAAEERRTGRASRPGSLGSFSRSLSQESGSGGGGGGSVLDLSPRGGVSPISPGGGGGGGGFSFAGRPAPGMLARASSTSSFLSSLSMIAASRRHSDDVIVAAGSMTSRSGAVAGTSTRRSLSGSVSEYDESVF